MTNVIPNFRLHKPATLAEALALLQSEPGARLCAGGTDLIVNMRRGLVEAETLIDLTNVGEMKLVESSAAGTRIGAGVTLNDLIAHIGIAADYPAVSQAAAAIAGPSHRQVATVGGNLCLDTRCQYYNQSHWWRKANDFCLKFRGEICHVAPQGNRCRAAFSGDLAPALMVHGAELDLAGPNGMRRVPLAEFYQEDGADYMRKQADEIVVAVHLPPGGQPSAYEKIRVRGAVDFPLAGVAVARTGEGFAVALTGTNSCPMLLDDPGNLPDEDTDAYFAALEKQVQKQVSPQRTTLIQPHYRRLSIAAIAGRLARALA